ncbi:tetratricopeptide repeat protein [Flavobacterium suncheonense]|uniref:tetratricopeptide repeat protein n=1 Tax=Flavobacterium suncheonense TaxID=350894 RepID=UPI003FA39BE1
MKSFLFLLFFPLLLWSQSDFEKGESLFRQKKYASAQPFFQNHLKQNPADFKTIEYLGDIAGHQKQWDEAISYYKKLKQQFPKTANYHYKFGGALGMKAKSVSKFKALGMIGDIKEAFETAAHLDKKHIDTRWALVMLYIELPGIVGGSETKAQKYAEELMQLSKVDGYLAKGYIDVYFKRYAKAEIHLKKAHEIGHSKTTFEKLYDLYLNKLKNTEKAQKLKTDFNT